jgi:hypothetical protein
VPLRLARNVCYFLEYDLFGSCAVFLFLPQEEQNPVTLFGTRMVLGIEWH